MHLPAGAGYISTFCLGGGGGKMRLYELLGGGKYISMCKERSKLQTREVWVHAPPGNFDFGPFIRHNLVESGNVFAQT